jgi:hypothetical protein
MVGCARPNGQHNRVKIIKTWCFSWIKTVLPSAYRLFSLARKLLGLIRTIILYIRFEVFTAVTMKNVVFWDLTPCRFCVNRSLQPPAYAGSSLADFFTLKMEEIRSSETSAHTRSTRRYISLLFSTWHMNWNSRPNTSFCWTKTWDDEQKF